MGKGKLNKFEEINRLPNVFQVFDFHRAELRNAEGEFIDLKGQWSDKAFNNTKPIVLDLACGKGEYTIGLAAMYPNANYIGIDLKGNRIWNGASYAHENQLNNVAFIRTRIELINHFFAENEVNEIWITFADPFLNETKANKRLTSPYFIDIYRPLLKPGGVIHLKTDSDELYHYTLEVIEDLKFTVVENDPDIYKNGDREGALGIKTYYEKMHLENNKKIKYVAFQLS